MADNGSADQTAQVVRQVAESRPWVRLVSANAMTSAAYARNAGVAVAVGDILLFCDADDVVGDGWVEALGSAVRKHPLVVGRLEYTRLNRRSEARYRAAAQSDGAVHYLGIPTVVSASFGCQRWLWELLSGQDESLSGGEDVDFGLRAFLDADVEVVFESAALVHYRLRSTARESFRQGYRYGRASVELHGRYKERVGKDLKVMKIALAHGLRGAAWCLRALGRAERMVRSGFELGQSLGYAAASGRKALARLQG